MSSVVDKGKTRIWLRRTPHHQIRYQVAVVNSMNTEGTAMGYPVSTVVVNQSLLRSWFSSQYPLDRARNITQWDEKLKMEESHLMKIFVRNGCPQAFVCSGAVSRTLRDHGPIIQTQRSLQ